MRLLLKGPVCGSVERTPKQTTHFWSAPILRQTHAGAEGIWQPPDLRPLMHGLWAQETTMSRAIWWRLEGTLPPKEARVTLTAKQIHTRMGLSHNVQEWETSLSSKTTQVPS